MMGSNHARSDSILNLSPAGPRDIYEFMSRSTSSLNSLHSLSPLSPLSILTLLSSLSSSSPLLSLMSIIVAKGRMALTSPLVK